MITEAVLTLAGGHDYPTLRRSLSVDGQADGEPKAMAIRAEFGERHVAVGRRRDRRERSFHLTSMGT